MSSLIEQELSVTNVGLAQFAETIADNGASATQLEWTPPALGDREAGMALARLTNHPLVEEANAAAFSAFRSTSPRLHSVGTAHAMLPTMGERTILHAGPPVEWAQMCGPMQGAIVGAILYEGWASGVNAAGDLAASGNIVFEPCHHHGCVGPMAGVISPSMPLWAVENPATGVCAFSNFNEGLGKALRFGAYEDDVLARLKWIETTLALAVGAALKALGGIDLKPLIAQALIMGDEVHNRNAAASGLLLRRLASALVRVNLPADDLARILDFIVGNEHFFLNISMASCKLMLDAAHRVAGSSMVTAMSRNGVEFGIRVSGLGDRWFTTVAGEIDGLCLPATTRPMPHAIWVTARLLKPPVLADFRWPQHPPSQPRTRNGCGISRLVNQTRFSFLRWISVARPAELMSVGLWTPGSSRSLIPGLRTAMQGSGRLERGSRMRRSSASCRR